MTHETRLEHLRRLEESGINPYPSQFIAATHSCDQIQSEADRLGGSAVTVGGRIMARRDHGKLCFYKLEDQTGAIQIKIMDGQTTNFHLIRDNYDSGDIVLASGVVDQNKSNNQPLIHAEEMIMLSKSLLPPPDKTKSLAPSVARRQRYLELMADPEARNRFRMRARMVQIMREEFLSYGFLEVETPVIDNIYGGAIARPFKTHMNSLDQDMYLRVSNELYLKRLICGNMGPVFEFSRNFRNEGIDRIHNPEFTLVELYKPYTDYTYMMCMSEAIFERVAIDLHGTTKIDFGGKIIDFASPWDRISIWQGLQKAFTIDPDTITDESLGELAINMKIDTKYQTRDDRLLALFEKYYDGKFTKPTFVLDYPRTTSPLAKQHRQNPNLAERVECYIGGIAVMNSYTELNDPRDQNSQFLSHQRNLANSYGAVMPLDKDFLVAMQHGFPPMAGIGISIDRMAMIMTDTQNIRDIILFPPVKRHNVRD